MGVINRIKYDINSILEPKSIAIIGVSSNKEHISYSFLENLINSNYEGIIYPVNPKLKAIKGLKVYNDVSEIPIVDLAVIILKPSIAIQTIETAAKKGIKNFIVLSSGFAETEEGQIYQDKLIELSNKYNLTILGPNCVGVINTYYNLNATFATKYLPKQGNISIIAQSGGFTLGIVKFLTKRNIGISKLISVGNKAILQESHFLQYLYNDETTKSIILYFEDIKNIEEFEKIALELLKINKPIIVFKGGTTKEGQIASSSHTAALTGHNEIYNALINKYNLIKVDKIGDLYNIALLLSKNFELFKDKKSKKVLIITNCGGCGVITTDFAIKNNLEVPHISDSFKQDLYKVLPQAAGVNNPIDIVGDADHIRFKNTLEIALAHKNEYDTLLLVPTQQSVINMEKVSNVIADIEPEFTKQNIPIVCCMYSLDIFSKDFDNINKTNIPIYEYPEEAIYPISKIIEYNIKREIILQYKNIPLIELDIDYNKIKEIILNTQKAFIPINESIKILEILQINLPKYQIINNLNELETLNLEYPLVMKSLSPDIIHKTEKQAVILNIKNKKELINSYNKLKELHPSVLIQEMIEKDIELIIGYKKDKILNKGFILLGLGGIFTEILKKFETILIPISQEEIIEALNNLNILKIFQNYRNKKYDLNKLVDIILKINELVLKVEEIEEIDLNPVIVNEQGVFAVDIRIKKI
ncbi:MAG: acetate--CoA ligase family protein [bacterium]